MKLIHRIFLIFFATFGGACALHATWPLMSAHNVNFETLADGHSETLRMLSARVGNEKVFKIASSLTFPNRQVFYFSNIIRSPCKTTADFVVMYAKNRTNQFVPRLLYRKPEEGTWLVNTGLSAEEAKRFTGSSGNVFYGVRPVEEIIVHLDKSESRGEAYATEHYSDIIDKLDPPFDLFADGRIEDSEMSGDIETFAEEVTLYSLPTEFATLRRTPAFFQPNFDPNRQRTRPRSYQFRHALLGGTEVSVFVGRIAKDRFEWHMAVTGKGDVWVERIEIPGTRITSYGTAPIMVDASFLTTRPVALVNTSLPPDPMVGETALNPFIDMTPEIDKQRHIVAFRNARFLMRGWLPHIELEPHLAQMMKKPRRI